MTIADDAMAARAGFLIARWGRPAQLLRDTTLRTCTAAILEHSPRAAKLALDGAERILIAAPLAIEPDHELDFIIFNARKYSIVAPVKGPRPGGIAIYYDCDALYLSAYP